MLLIECPYCREARPEIEFRYAGEAHLARPEAPDTTDAEFAEFLYMRANPKGLHFERWRCDRGCGKWFHAARDTVTMEFKAFYGISELPPREVMEQATGEWAAYFKDRLKAEAKS